MEKILTEIVVAAVMSGLGSFAGVYFYYRFFEREICMQAPDKKVGECISCKRVTNLVLDTDLCGPCCFGEADTANGNW